MPFDYGLNLTKVRDKDLILSRSVWEIMLIPQNITDVTQSVVAIHHSEHSEEAPKLCVKRFLGDPSLCSR
jgi:hypothetical protein